ncbi:MAG TPA: YkgJ family cysteine cluster protein, partial [Solirubrobacter sp.]|nr:YkgJ family cysteine cluster protein [Solirubrobacter sp.]
HATRAVDADALANGLAALLIQRGVVSADELQEAIESARVAIEKSGRDAIIEVAVRTDKDWPSAEAAEIDCEARIPYCRAACCSMSFPLSVPEIEAGGPLKWDLGRPYFNRHGPEGYCHQLDVESHACGIYDQRPLPCRQYSCVHDERIWKDFDAMIPNDEWLDARFEQGDRGPVEIFMDAYRSS